MQTRHWQVSTVAEIGEYREHQSGNEVVCEEMSEETKKSHSDNGMRFSYLLSVNSVDYSAAASVAGASTGASTGASALGAAFLPARRVVFLAAALGVLSMFSL